MSKFKVGDKVFHLYNGKRFPGTGIGVVVKVDGGMVTTRWSNKKRYPGTCTDAESDTILLDPDKIIKIGGIEVYVEEFTLDGLVDGYINAMMDMS